jgi:very-short-patch-repair endonuclease
MAYFQIGREEHGIEITVPAHLRPRCPGLVIHRRRNLQSRHFRFDGPIRVTNPALTLVDFAVRHDRDEVEQAVNDADRSDVIDLDRLRILLDDYKGWNGARLLRDVLDIRTFTMTDSELERRMRPIIRRVGLSKPLTQHRLSGFKVDFYWPEIGLVLETDGLRYHRTPAQQAKDRIRDQIHTAAGRTPLRFTRAQVRFDPDHVEVILGAVAKRLIAAAAAA